MKPIPVKYDLTHIPSAFSYYATVLAIHQPYVDDDGNVHNIRHEHKNKFAPVSADVETAQDIPDIDEPLYEIVITKPGLFALIDILVEEELKSHGISKKKLPQQP